MKKILSKAGGFILTLAIILAIGGYFGYKYCENSLVQVHEREIAIKDTEIEKYKTSTSQVSGQVVSLKNLVDSLIKNPEIKWKAKVVKVPTPYAVAGDTEYVEIEVPVVSLATDTLKYTGDGMFKFKGIASDEGDSLSFNIWQKVALDVLADTTGKIYIEDTPFLQIRNIKLFKNYKVADKKDKIQVYVGAIFDMSNPTVTYKNPIVKYGANVIFNERWNTSLYLNKSNIQLGVGFKIYRKE